MPLLARALVFAACVPLVAAYSCATSVSGYQVWDPQVVGTGHLNGTAANAWPQQGTDNTACLIVDQGGRPTMSHTECECRGRCWATLRRRADDVAAPAAAITMNRFGAALENHEDVIAALLCLDFGKCCASCLLGENDARHWCFCGPCCACCTQSVFTCELLHQHCTSSCALGKRPSPPFCWKIAHSEGFLQHHHTRLEAFKVEVV